MSRHGQGSFLLVGADGQIGSALAAQLRKDGAEVFETTRRPETTSQKRIFLDLAADSPTFSLPIFPSVAFLGAGVTTLSACRSNAVTSAFINVQRTVALAKMLVERDCFVVLPSTNLVFDGTLPYRRPHDPPSPQTEYGRQKTQAERQILALGGAAVIRFTKVLSSDGILTQWARAIRRHETIYPFSDVKLAPITLAHAVEAIRRLAKYRLPGIFHSGPDGEVTYAEAAQRIAWRLGLRGNIEPTPYRVNDIESLAKFTTLSTSRSERELGLATPPVWDAIDWAADQAGPACASESERLAQ